MADGTITDISNDGSVIKVNWNLTTVDHTGAEVQAVEYSERSVQIAGTFSSATVIIQGSNDGTNWASLRDKAGDVISITSAGLVSIQELTQYLRPKLSVVGTVADLEINMIARKSIFTWTS